MQQMQQGYGVLQFLGALIGAALAFLGGMWAQSMKSQDTSKEILTRTVTSERAQWRADLRNVAGEFVETAWRLIKEGPASMHELQKLRVLIKLRLNPNQGHPLDQQILTAIVDVTKHVAGGEVEAATKALQSFEDGLQALLKQEWDKSKQEAKTGQLTIRQRESATNPRTATGQMGGVDKG